MAGRVTEAIAKHEVGLGVIEAHAAAVFDALLVEVEIGRHVFDFERVLVQQNESVVKFVPARVNQGEPRLHGFEPDRCTRALMVGSGRPFRFLVQCFVSAIGFQFQHVIVRVPMVDRVDGL